MMSIPRKVDMPRGAEARKARPARSEPGEHILAENGFTHVKADLRGACSQLKQLSLQLAQKAEGGLAIVYVSRAVPHPQLARYSMQSFRLGRSALNRNTADADQRSGVSGFAVDSVAQDG
jgi:hypothetical protein